MTEDLVMEFSGPLHLGTRRMLAELLALACWVQGVLVLIAPERVASELPCDPQDVGPV